MGPKKAAKSSDIHEMSGESVALRAASLMKSLHVLLITLQILDLLAAPSSGQTYRRQKQLSPTTPKPAPHDNVVAEMQVVCQSDAIVLTVNTNHPFNGMLYAKDAPSSNSCISEFHSSTNMTFKLPLKSCGTLSAEVDDGIEYFNTVVVQPHMRLMTNQGKGYHIRCKYQTRERTIANNQFNVSAAFLMQNQPQGSTAPLLATASMPMCTMKIYRIDQDNVAESVRVGDKLVMVIEIDKQDMYGMRISNCVVRDGMNKAEQLLINDQGCPVDETIMPKFDYENNNTRAAVAFKAHKFPHTSSVYYQCNVRLCINNGGCDQINCPQEPLVGSGSERSAVSNAITAGPSANVTGGPRRKRFVLGHLGQSVATESVAQRTDTNQGQEREGLPDPSKLMASMGKEDDLSFDVYSGLHVSDVSEIGESNAGDPNGQQVLPASRNGNSQAGRKDEIGQSSSSSSSFGGDAGQCLTIGKASLLVVVASFCSVALVLLIACQAGLVGANETHDERPFQQTGRSFNNSGGDPSYSPPLDHHSSNARHFAGASDGYAPRTRSSKSHDLMRHSFY